MFQWFRSVRILCFSWQEWDKTWSFQRTGTLRSYWCKPFFCWFLLSHTIGGTKKKTNLIFLELCNLANLARSMFPSKSSLLVDIWCEEVISKLNLSGVEQFEWDPVNRGDERSWWRSNARLRGSCSLKVGTAGADKLHHAWLEQCDSSHVARLGAKRFGHPTSEEWIRQHKELLWFYTAASFMKCLDHLYYSHCHLKRLSQRETSSQILL